MSDDVSVSNWLASLQQGDRDAAQQLWVRYFQNLVRLAAGLLPGHARRDFDEEDVALSAFHSFLEGVRHDRFPQLEDRHDLWSLLVVITRRKALAYRRMQTRQKRGGGLVLGESGLAGGDASTGTGFDALMGEEPTPAFAAQAAEQCQLLLQQLGDETLRAIALLKLQGYTNDEIAVRTNSTRRTVERRLHIIRKKWLACATGEEEGA